MTTRSVRWLWIAVALGFASPAFGQLNDGLQAIKRGAYASAYRYLSVAAEQGNPQARHNLGFLYLHGLGTPQDDHKAFLWIRQAAEQRYPPAQAQLGMLYRTGRGVERSDLLARDWLLKAAEQGDAEAQFNLGTLLDDGMDFRFDDPAAAEIVARLRKSNNMIGTPFAIAEKGQLRDPGQAFRWLQKAVDQGHKAAHVNLANMLRDSKNAPPDFERAMKLYKAVANESDRALEGAHDVFVAVSARTNIAIMYQRGQGVAVDQERATFWYCKAASLGRQLPNNAAPLAASACPNPN
jgi:TPR repeat protein